MPTLPIAATSTVMPSLPLPPTLSHVCVSSGSAVSPYTILLW